MKKGRFQKIIIATFIAVLIILISIYIISSLINPGNENDNEVNIEKPAFLASLQWYHVLTGVIGIIIFIFFILWILSRLEAFKK